MLPATSTLAYASVWVPMAEQLTLVPTPGEPSSAKRVEATPDTESIAERWMSAGPTYDATWSSVVAGAAVSMRTVAVCVAHRLPATSRAASATVVVPCAETGTPTVYVAAEPPPTA